MLDMMKKKKKKKKDMMKKSVRYKKSLWAYYKFWVGALILTEHVINK